MAVKGLASRSRRERVHEALPRASGPLLQKGWRASIRLRAAGGLRDRERAVKDKAVFSTRMPHPAELASRPGLTEVLSLTTQERCELDIPIMMQVGHNLIYSRERRLPSVGRLDSASIRWLSTSRTEAAWHPYRHSVDRRDDLDGLEARERLHRGGCLRAEALAAAARALSRHLWAAQALFGTDWPAIDPSARWPRSRR